MKFNHLNVPTHWRNYWSRYPEGHTILEALISWVSQVDSMVDNQNKLNDNVEQFRNEIDAFVERFDERLQVEVTQTLSDWQTSGFLDVVISEALQWQLDDYIATNEQDKVLINEQLAQKANENRVFDMVNIKEFEDLVIRDEVGNKIDWSPVFEAAFNSGASKVVFPNWTMKYKETILIPNHVKEIDFSKAILQYEKEQSTTAPSYMESGFVGIGVHDLTIKGGKHEYLGTYDYGQSYGGFISALYFEMSDNVIVEKLEASGFNRAGVNFATGDGYSGYCDNPKVIECNLHHNRVAGLIFGNTDGMEVKSSKLNYNGLASDNATGYGLAGWSSKLPKNTHVHHNQANFNHRKGIDFHAGENGIIDNNMCRGNKYYGIFVSGGTNKNMGDWQVSHNQIKDMSNDGAILAQSTYGIHVGANQGTAARPTNIILDGNIITGLNQTSTGVVLPYVLYLHGLSYGKVIITNSITDVENIERFITTDSNSPNPGNYTDLSITNSEFKAKNVTSPAFSVLTSRNRNTDFSGNKVEIIEDYTQNLLFAYASSTALGGDVHTYFNNDLKVQNTTPWSYDPLHLKRTNKEKAVDNYINGLPLRDWDGYKFKDDGTAPPEENYYTRGSKRENSRPSANNPVGWVCTETGSPGTWVGYGTLEA